MARVLLHALRRHMGSTQDRRASEQETPSTRPDPDTGTWESAPSPLPPPRYRILRVLGEGGMGVVYGAWDEAIDRPVALKELRGGSQFPREALEREGRALGAVHHPNVVTLYALDLDGAAPHLVMEWANGVTLERILTRGRLALDHALELLRQIAAGIDAIHHADVIHGDVKPGNVLVDGRGHVKLVDFGVVPLLARMHVGDLVGTPAYMSPERARGAPPDHRTDPRSDVYSFAVMCFELLTGRLPFEHDTPEALVLAHLHERAPRASEVSDLGRNFDEPLSRALGKHPEQRPMSCSALVSALRRARDATDVHGRSLRVLVVDDDADFRGMLTEVLAHGLRGATVVTASDGQGGLTSALHRPPHVAFLDLSMPGLGGIELARELRARVPEVEIVIVTGHGSAADWRVAQGLGVRRFMLKPVSGPDILDVVQNVASHTRAHRER